MKKTEWFIVIAIFAMGILCLSASAASFRGLSWASLSRLLSKGCLAMAIIVGGAALISWFVRKNKF